MQPSFSLCKQICQQNFFLPYIRIVPFVHSAVESGFCRVTLFSKLYCIAYKKSPHLLWGNWKSLRVGIHSMLIIALNQNTVIKNAERFWGLGWKYDNSRPQLCSERPVLPLIGKLRNCSYQKWGWFWFYHKTFSSYTQFSSKKRSQKSC